MSLLFDNVKSGTTGEMANVPGDSDIFLAVDGVDSGRVVLHGYAPSLSVDQFQHVRSGFDAEAGKMTIGFEDLLGGGDRDHEDVIFSVTGTDLDIV